MSTRTAFTRSFLVRYRRAYNALIDVDEAYAGASPAPPATPRHPDGAPRHRRASGEELPGRDAAPPALPRGAERDLRRAALHPEGPRACHLARHVPDAQVHRAEPPGAAPVRLHARGRAPAARVHDRSGGDPRSRPDGGQRATAHGGCRDHRRERPGHPAGRGASSRASRSVARATSVFLEETRFAERQSVVHVLPRLPRAPGRLIPTLWTSGSGGDLVCETICQAYCSHSGSGIGFIGYCGHVKDRHVGKT